MLASVEIYKGIEFVRISHLPADQQEKIKASIKRDQIIKILIGNTLADDCVQYHHYKAWFLHTYPAKVIISQTAAVAQAGLALSQKVN
ncbi:MAG: hypothetical protein KF856_00665 [Cyclobacteriaceae bacterium]|nr:hypothetical protein [Cyclobacteriaceae bacterium]